MTPILGMPTGKAAKLAAVQTLIAYDFRNSDYLWEALQAAGSGVTVAGNRTFPDGNKNMALFGDCVMKLVILDGWLPTQTSRSTYHTVGETIVI